MQNPNITYSIVVPVYNSVESVAELTYRINAVFRHTILDGYEIIFVDDGSSNPQTWPTLEQLAQEFSHVTAIQLTRNFGKQGAIICGLTEAKGKWIITMDDDLQHLPEDIPIMLVQKEHDIVMGVFRKKHHSYYVRASSYIKGWFDIKILGRPQDVYFSPFKVIKSEVADQMIRINTPYPYIPALMTFVTRDIVSVEVSHHPRLYGKAGFTFIKRCRQFSNLVISNSSFFLQCIAYVGIFCLIFSTFLGGFLLFVGFILNQSLNLSILLIEILLILGGLNLLSIGLVGEYLFRIIRGIEDRPSYVIRRKAPYQAEDDLSKNTSYSLNKKTEL